MRALSAVQALAGLNSDLGEWTTVRACFTVDVWSEAEVDGAAAVPGIIPQRPSLWQYEAVSHRGGVTLAVVFTDEDLAPEDGAA